MKKISHITIALLFTILSVACSNATLSDKELAASDPLQADATTEQPIIKPTTQEEPTTPKTDSIIAIFKTTKGVRM